MEQLIARTLTKLYNVTADVRLTRPDPKFGDWATNVALQIAKPLARSPREIATEIAEALRETGEFSAVDVAGPGFINLTLDAKHLLAALGAQQQPATGESVVIETNNPNPFKAMHIGHAFNATLGDTIARMLELQGHTVHRVSYHGDVGAHVGKSMWAILRYVDGNLDKLSEIAPEERNVFMSKMYADGAKAYTEDDVAKAAIDELAKQSFTLDDPLYKAVYDTCMAWSFDQIDTIVAKLGNVPIEKRYLESQADPVGVAVVRDNVGTVFTESDGALVFEGSKYGSFDNAFVASNGRGLYAARDLGLMQLKDADFSPTKSYIATAEEQRAYFRGVIAAAGLCMPKLAEQTVNISTGTVLLSTGKMSSRSGDVVAIDWLFEQFKQAIAERGGQPTDEIAAGALRYQFLKVKIGSDVVFDVAEAVSLQGNTGSYLQYAHARARRILENDTITTSELTDVHAEDRTLVRKLGEYNDVLARAAEHLEPHHLCSYLFELAQEFNRYYEQNQVVGSDQQDHRAALVRVYADTLKRGLGVLGIHAPQSM